MPPGAFALVALFLVVAVVAGVGAAWVVGPRRRFAGVVPSVVAFGTLYLIGHRLGLSIGPTVVLFGFDVALLGDVLSALAAAFAAALVQRAALASRSRASA